MGKKEKIACDTCGKIFEKYSSKIGKNNFCCRECYLQFHSKDTSYAYCEVCGKSFKTMKGNANKFCSRECYLQYHKIEKKERICPVCGKKFLAKTSSDKYCSWECYNKDRHMPKGSDHWNWKGGISIINDNRDSALYKEWRKNVYQRDNYKCQYCGSKEKLNAHHLKSWKKYPELRYDINNGITLCEKCHIQLHQQNGYIDFEEDGQNPPISFSDSKK